MSKIFRMKSKSTQRTNVLVAYVTLVTTAGILVIVKQTTVTRVFLINNRVNFQWRKLMKRLMKIFEVSKSGKV